MTTHEIAVFSTQDLYDYCNYIYNGYGYRARNSAANILETAWEHISQEYNLDYNLNVISADHLPDPPQETLHPKFEYDSACDGDYKKELYGSLHKWWVDYHDCANLTGATNCEVLLTNAPDGGGLAFDKRCVAACGQDIAKFYPTQTVPKYGSKTRHKKAEVLLEEVGHSLIDETISKDSDGDGEGHDWGNVDKHNGSYYITPIGVTVNTSLNNCGNSVDKEKWSGEGWKLRYSKCAAQNFEGESE